MSNKPKNVKRLVKYTSNKAERKHIALVREAKKQGYKHSGSKSMHVLHNIIPTKYNFVYKGIRRLFSK